jgi:hypothetical protein
MRKIQTSSDKPDWLVQAEKDYGMPMTYPQASDELGTLGYPKSEIDKSKIVIQSNLDQIQKDNLESLEEKKKDPKSNPPKYGVTIASIYPPEEFLSKNTGLKSFMPPPPQSGRQPPLASSYGTVVVPDKSKILPSLNYSNLTGGIKLPVYNQSQCGCCWVVSCTATLNYHLFKQSSSGTSSETTDTNETTGSTQEPEQQEPEPESSSGKLNKIVYPNLYTFCVKPNPPRGFSRQSNGCQGGIPTDVFVDINDVKTLAVIPNQPQNLQFKQQDNNCQRMLQPQSNPLLTVESIEFPSKGVVALYNDGKFYYNKEVKDPYTFLPTSKLTAYDRTKVFTDEQIDTIKYLLCTNGPMVVGMNAAKTRNITQYKSGILEFPGGTPDHAIILIGYQDNYWIMQNSWSEKWGMNGLMYVDINKSYLTMMTALVSDYTEFGKLNA